MYIQPYLKFKYYPFLSSLAQKEISKITINNVIKNGQNERDMSKNQTKNYKNK